MSGGWFSYNSGNPREHSVDCNDYLVVSVLMVMRGIPCVVERTGGPDDDRTLTVEGGKDGAEGCVFTFNKDGRLKSLKAF